MTVTYPERGSAFQGVWERCKRLPKDVAATIHIGHGPDEVCSACSFFDGHECIHPQGNENAVRKWDAKIVRELGLEEGQQLSVARLNELIEQHSPLSFCLTKCPHYLNGECNPLAVVTQ